MTEPLGVLIATAILGLCLVVLCWYVGKLSAKLIILERRTDSIRSEAFNFGYRIGFLEKLVDADDKILSKVASKIEQHISEACAP